MERSAGMVLFRERNGKREYLLLHYNYKSEYWGLAKGLIEKDESEEDTALRETKEETGLEKIEFVNGFKNKIGYFLKREEKVIYKEVIWFLGKVSDENDGKVSEEHDKLGWFSYEETLKMMKFKKDRSMVVKAEKFLKNK
ncbi:MAG: NUDIX domain-containing protein [Nanoarchaeota archaeon]|nr:NUDIX domain-containing protein [Nanoarchaeota archaeon]MBU1632230.1 NUDIX domain-containing protein [Nanoarchaeota archaeon]MBU1876514.1 NUDIX domain-containing protein [Nanoarchaeota archaeon]